MPTTNPVTIVANPGVLYFGCISANFLGINPSRLIVIQMRGCPIWNTNNTLVMATTAAIDTINNIHFTPFKAKISAKGSLTPSSVYDTIPVMTKAKII